MRAIVKGPEPPGLTAYRQTPGVAYEHYPGKDALRRALVAEQRGLCCYCMETIRPGPFTMKIEHWRCQKHYPGVQLVYRNLLGACMGGEKGARHKRHCDTQKGSRDLLWNPADPAHAIESRVQYDLHGTIRSADETFNKQLNQVLNLNLTEIKNRRKAINNAITQWWTKEKAKYRGPVPRARIERARAKFMPAHGNLSPYCQVAVWWLSQKLARMPR